MEALAEEYAGVGAEVTGVVIGEMEADVAEGGGSEEGVGEGVKCYVGVAVSEEAEMEWDVYAAEDEWAGSHEAMDVVTGADAEHGEEGVR